MNDKYRLDPNFVVSEPIPANHFDYVADSGAPEARQQIISETCERWKAAGVKQMRATLTGPGVDNSIYPAGLWLEGWIDPAARQLPFGAPWPKDDSAIWPPLSVEASQ